jgi:hypothetical protein
MICTVNQKKRESGQRVNNRLLEDLIGRAMDMGVKLVLIADPGRSFLDTFSENLVKDMSGERWDPTVEQPYSFLGKVTKAGSV